MNIAVLQFPGSNCDQDAFQLFATGLGLPTRFVWHKDTKLGDADLVVVPGGFSYGDYLRCGAIARFSPIMAAVKEFSEKGGLVLGICNGFQILCEAGMLPGALIRNSSLEFRCVTCDLAVEDAGTAFNTRVLGRRIRLPIAHGEGNYRIDDAGKAQLEANGQILLRYVDNPNGSMGGIAGIRNEEGNVFGMMPHPDRAFERFHPSSDGIAVARAVLSVRYPDLLKKSA
ncbi:MAG TPA: phosphoribosylformylglycinamidine synthase subunit PurQ [Opitutaceae bacterium]|jgi:phosphoribosylformylglycinamidine synthase|nr:phosphoribosylformylglycinamidine synthase subunit PurQ [Opitutaceae bacterium]